MTVFNVKMHIKTLNYSAVVPTGVIKQEGREWGKGHEKGKERRGKGKVEGMTEGRGGRDWEL